MNVKIRRRSIAFARAIIRASSRTPLRGIGGYGPTADEVSASDPALRFRQAYAERDDVGAFYVAFPSLREAMAAKSVLDFGCGYGGKAVEFARHARSVAAIEPFDNMIRAARDYAASVSAANVEFRVCDQERIPYDDETFDLVLSHDVLEHVDNPETSLSEIHRVLKPGGRAYIVFPPYDGMMSHHLDYLSRVPGLHWMFSAHTLVNAVNSILETSNVSVSRQPEPRRAWTGKRYVLPQLNGLTGPEFEALAGRYFASAAVDYRLLGVNRRTIAVSALRKLLFAPFARTSPLNRDRVTGSIAAVLTK